MLRVKSLQFSLHQGREVKLQHFTRRNELFRTWQKRYFRTRIFLFISLTGLTHSPSCTAFGMLVNRVLKDCLIVGLFLKKKKKEKIIFPVLCTYIPHLPDLYNKVEINLY